MVSSFKSGPFVEYDSVLLSPVLAIGGSSRENVEASVGFEKISSGPSERTKYSASSLLLGGSGRVSAKIPPSVEENKGYSPLLLGIIGKRLCVCASPPFSFVFTNFVTQHLVLCTR